MLNFLSNLSLDKKSNLVYNYKGSNIYQKPYGCEKSDNCECKEIFTSILNGSKECPNKLFDIGVADTMICFCSLTFLSHMLISTILFKKYLIWIKKDKTNFLRWIEYSITSSIMILSISGLTGIINSEELIPIFILTGVTNMFGLAIESIKSNKKKYRNVKKLMFLSGIITQGYPWFRILSNFKSSITQQNNFFNCIKDNLDSVPLESGVKEILEKRIKSFNDIQSIIKQSTLALFFNYFSFPYIMYKQYFKGPITDKKYCHGELEYVVASIVSKSSLAWQIFGGAFREN